MKLLVLLQWPTGDSCWSLNLRSAIRLFGGDKLLMLWNRQSKSVRKCQLQVRKFYFILFALGVMVSILGCGADRDLDILELQATVLAMSMNNLETNNPLPTLEADLGENPDPLPRAHCRPVQSK